MNVREMIEMLEEVENQEAVVLLFDGDGSMVILRDAEPGYIVLERQTGDEVFYSEQDIDGLEDESGIIEPCFVLYPM